MCSQGYLCACVCACWRACILFCECMRGRVRLCPIFCNCMFPAENFACSFSICFCLFYALYKMLSSYGMALSKDQRLLPEELLQIINFLRRSNFQGINVGYLPKTSEYSARLSELIKLISCFLPCNVSLTGYTPVFLCASLPVSVKLPHLMDLSILTVSARLNVPSQIGGCSANIIALAPNGASTTKFPVSRNRNVHSTTSESYNHPSLD